MTGFVSQPQVVAHGASRWLDFVRVGGSMLYRLAHKNSGLCVECVSVSLCLFHPSNKSAQSVSVCLLSIFSLVFFLSSMCETLLKVPSGELVVLFVCCTTFS